VERIVLPWCADLADEIQGGPGEPTAAELAFSAID
jgi:hypothetical protein